MDTFPADFSWRNVLAKPCILLFTLQQDCNTREACRLLLVVKVVFVVFPNSAGRIGNSTNPITRFSGRTKKEDFKRSPLFYCQDYYHYPDFVIAYPKKYKSYNFSRQECKKQGFSRIGGRACYFTRLFARLPKQQKQPLIIKHLQTYFEKVTKSGKRGSSGKWSDATWTHGKQLEQLLQQDTTLRGDNRLFEAHADIRLAAMETTMNNASPWTHFLLISPGVMSWRSLVFCCLPCSRIAIRAKRVGCYLL